MDLMWTCPTCGVVVPMKKDEFPIKCRCGNVGELEEASEKDDRKMRGPSCGVMGLNFAKATLKDIAHGFKRITEDQYNSRINTCRDCKFSYNINGEPHRCLHRGCGCFLKLKAWRVSERCPEGYWEELSE